MKQASGEKKASVLGWHRWILITRRDKPGKSPMGMDLIPVYEEESSGDDFGPGAVKIAPSCSE